MTEPEGSCSSSNFDFKHSNCSESTEGDDGEFEEFDIDRCVWEIIDSAEREASRICAEKERTDSVKPISPWRNFANLCLTKCRANRMKMFSSIALFYCLVNLALFFLRTTQIVRGPPPAVPFFRPPNGTVEDLFDGDGLVPELLMSKSEFVIVMLYAQWDYRCKYFRRPFSDVANAFSNINSIKFVAANCHYYRGQCKRMYRVNSYPVIFAYSPYPNGHPILFNQILSADRLFSWVLHLLNPVQRIHSVDELRSAVLSSEFLAVGHFSFEDASLPRSYHVFLNAAYKLANFRSSLALAIVLNRTLARDQLGFDSDNQVNLYTFYQDNAALEQIASTDIEPSSAKSRELVNWLRGQIDAKFEAKRVHELELEDLETAGKSEALFRRLSSSSATLVLFSHSLGLRSLSQSQIALRNFVKIFHHCPPFLENLERRPMSEGFFRAPSLGHLFSESRKICTLKAEQLDLCCSEFAKRGKCGKLAKRHTEIEQPNEGDDDSRNCEEILSFFSEGHQFRRFCCVRRKGNATTNSAKVFAHLSWHQILMCKFDRLLLRRSDMRRQQLHSEVSSDANADFSQLTHSWKWLLGAGCRLNKSLGFLTIDKRFGRHFMEKWGIMTDEDDLVDSVVIVTREDERIFAMEKRAKSVTMSDLADFVDGFYNNTLKWTPKNEEINEPIGAGDGTYSASILERINRQMFLDRILNRNRSFDAVVFFSGGPSHGPSQSVLHFFHQAQMFFKGFEEHIKFFIIDASKNSFDWHFDFSHLPTIAFFPVKSKETFVFRAEFAFSMPNLLGFIFPRCQPKLRWLLAFSLCRGQCLERNSQKIGRMVEKVREDIQILRGMIRKMRFGKDEGLRQSVASVRHFKTLLRRRQLQKTTLQRLSEIVDELKEDEEKGREGMAQSAIFAGWLLTMNGRIAANLPAR